MSERPRAVVLTSTFLRHRHLINAAADQLDLAGVWQEQKTFEPIRYASNGADERDIVRHFAARDESEAIWFAADRELRLEPRVVHRVVPPGAINGVMEIDAMRSLEPDVVLVFGTSLLGPAVIDALGGRLVNLHLGLSPYYRGAGTNFWPLVNREPEYVGATIHHLDAGVDSGPIISHARPALEPGDGPHDIGNRVIGAAVEVLMRVARRRQLPPAVPQEGGGRLYRRRDFSAEAVRTLYRNFATGMIAEYLANRAARDARIALVEVPVNR